MNDTEPLRKRRKLSPPQPLTFNTTNKLCQEKRPKHKLIKTQHYKKHVKAVKSELTLRSFRIYLPITFLHKNKEEDTKIYLQLLQHFKYIKFDGNKSGHKRAIFDSTTLRRPESIQRILCDLYLILRPSILSTVLINCSSKWFGLSETVYYTTQKSEILENKSKERNLSLKWGKFDSPFPEYPVPFYIGGQGGEYHYNLHDIVKDTKLKAVPDVRFLQELPTDAFKVDSHVLSPNKCKCCDEKGIWWSTLDSKDQTIVCGACLESLQNYIPDPVQIDGAYRIKKGTDIHNLSPDDVLHITEVSTVKFDRFEEADSKTEPPEQKLEENDISDENNQAMHKWNIKFAKKPHELTEIIKKAKDEYFVRYSRKDCHKTTHKKECILCHHTMYKGRRPGVWCGKCKWGIHRMCGGLTADAEKRICFGCLAWRNRKEISRILCGDGEYVEHEKYNPYRCEEGYIFRCYHKDDETKQKPVYYFQKVCDLSREKMVKILQETNKTVDYDSWMRITQTSEKVKDSTCKKTKFYRGDIKDANHALNFYLFEGKGIFTKKRETESLYHYPKAVKSIKDCDDEYIKTCNDQTKKDQPRDSLWFGMMPYGRKYCGSTYSPVDLKYNEHIMKLTEILNDVIKECVELEPELAYLGPINTAQAVNYIKNTCKQPHFDGPALTNHKQLWGFTLSEGKTMCLGSTMTYGQPDNRHNVIKIPKLSVYCMGPYAQLFEWHGVCKISKNWTLMGRYADDPPSLQGTVKK